MRLIADIKWNDCSSISVLRKQLVSFLCGVESTLQSLSRESALPASGQVELSVKCGKVTERSCFVFLRRSRNKSHIMGACSTNRLVDLIDDFDFLKEQIAKSNLTYSITDPKVILDGDKFIKETDRRFFRMKSVLADFLGIVAFASGTAYLFFGELNQITISLFVLGLFFWIGSIVAGERNRPKYVLIESE